MESLDVIITKACFILIIVTPFLIVVFCSKANIQSGFIAINVLSLPTMFALIALIAYWPHFYVDYRLELLGFDQMGMSDVERTMNVQPEFREEANKLFWLNMGIGWPLAAMMMFAPTIIYPSIVMIVVKIINRVFKLEFL